MTEERFTFEWPLWGMTLGDLPSGVSGALRIHDSLVYQPTWAQWSAMELRAVVDEFCRPMVFAEARGEDVAVLPPLCLARISDAGSDGNPQPSEQSHQSDARAVVAALRLYDGGDFVDPAETGTYITDPSGMTRRRVSPFRCALYDWSPENPYLLSQDALPDLESLTTACWIVAEDPAHQNAQLALNNFVLSFGFVTPPSERALHRVIALESLFGGVRSRAYAAPFAVRVANTTADPDETLAWLDGIDELRNALAHRITGVVPDSDDLEMLEYVVRVALIAYFNHCSSTETPSLKTFNEALASGPIP